ncbi:membrane fusion protein (multidrug efflux system) [Chromohalobacter marismortui]|uniref:Membrane fusion protein (Multidrug efflux system) n=1 Tax=Chromohalobacter marismortui TaxID=42055 RepID=A0A4R7NSM6_9GAMM|nr:MULTISPECIES: efflux RND transporter periplasmic adaptor subunit [Chromohalobacter]MCI0511314.1 efflux RND transporter periplasmic adaptor subunit [Chromohalobacter sp.]MCI0594074.1 efflux RND transporter periplasmic adaptor subunit [Chromohalobacter sp.]TDU23669.1 membrane fusion protein (multidrug efflux system) [Chromohalobacter marismortui]
MVSTTGNERRGFLAVALAGALLMGCSGGDDAGQQQAQSAAPPPTKAQVMEMAKRDIELDKSYPAMLRSDHDVTVAARVSGMLEERHFEPGQRVEKGQTLYTIEPEVYEAIVRQREADLASARANAELAQANANRYQRLLKQNSVSVQQRDQALADLKVARANVAQAQAALDSARIDLDYTTIEAPTSGMISLSEVNLGNLVNDGTELATITPLDPLEVRFQLPQEEAFQLRRQRQENDQQTITANLQIPGSPKDSLTGRIQFLGSRVDENTSTVQANAFFDNPDGFYLPGQFVRVKLEGLKRYDVYAVPEIAVTQGLMGPQVYVLSKENKVRTRTVQLGDTAGAWMIVKSGLDTGDRVVVSDIGNLSPGAVVEPQPFDGKAEAVPGARDAPPAAQQTSSAEPSSSTRQAKQASGA